MHSIKCENCLARRHNKVEIFERKNCMITHICRDTWYKPNRNIDVLGARTKFLSNAFDSYKIEISVEMARGYITDFLVCNHEYQIRRLYMPTKFVQFVLLDDHCREFYHKKEKAVSTDLLLQWLKIWIFDKDVNWHYIQVISTK